MAQKTLYSLVCSPLHWYNNIFSFYNSIGLTSSPNSPCVFQGTIITGHSSLYLGLYVDDFTFFSESDEIEDAFRQQLNKKYTLCYDESLEWFLGIYPPSNQSILTKKFQQIIGGLNWLSISTFPDITTVVSLLSAHSQSPSQAHFYPTLHVVKYIVSNPSHSLFYSSNDNEPMHAFVHFPSDPHSLQTY